MSNPEDPALPQWSAHIAVSTRYLGFLFFANLIWEFAQMPLYSLWYEGSWEEIIYSGIHCTVGDLMIGASALFLGVLFVGRSSWPTGQRKRVAFFTVLFGLAYTAFSEWMNVYQHKSWSYSELMPLLPGMGIGLSPLAQWIVLPVIGFGFAYRSPSKV